MKEREKRSALECIIHLRKPLGEGAQLQETTKCAMSSMWATVTQTVTLPIPFESSTTLRFRENIKIPERKVERQGKYMKQTLLPFPKAENKPPGNIQVREKRYFNLNMKFIFCSTLDFKYERDQKSVGFIFNE